MRGKSISEADQLLWRDSPCSLNCVVSSAPINNEHRFHYGSIYFRDQVNKPKKVFTQMEKPQLLLLNFRRQIEEVTMHARKTARNNESSAPKTIENKKKFKNTVPVQHTLYQQPEKLQMLHDKYGNRSSYKGQFQLAQVTRRFSQIKPNFYSSQRIDLAKPHNFYPGPGTYYRQKQGPQSMRSTYSHSMRNHSLPLKAQKV